MNKKCIRKLPLNLNNDGMESVNVEKRLFYYNTYYYIRGGGDKEENTFMMMNGCNI